MNILKLSTHWLVLIALVLGAALGLFIQKKSADSTIPVKVEWTVEGATVSDAGGIKDVQPGDRMLQLDGEAVSSEKAWDAVISRQSPGRVLSLTLQRDGGEPFSVPVKASMSPDSARARWIAPLDFIADLFLRLLKMLIVPLILTSIISGAVSYTHLTLPTKA